MEFNITGLSEKAGEKVESKEYDLVIVGGGPAGFTAGIYAARYKLKTLIVAESFGGYVAEASEIENYPGFIKINGSELAEKFKAHAEAFGVVTKQASVVEIKKENSIFLVRDSDNNVYKAKAVILALGTKRRKLNIPGEDEFLGKGVSYCATCDAPFFKGKIVGVVGGSDAAAKAALLLANYASKVYIIYRRDKLRAEPMTTEAVEKNEKIEIVYNANVVKLLGSKKLEKVVLDNGNELSMDGLFIEIGGIPSSSLASELGVKTDEKGYIIVNADQSTNVEGVFAAGDITTNSNKLQQIITAAAEGAIAAESAYEFIRKKSHS